MEKQKNVVFICTGNTCRSCMAEGIFRALAAQESSLSGYTTYSRGIHAFDGDNASEHSVNALMKLWNIDISLHKAKLIGTEDIENADLLLTMTRQHRDLLKLRYPDKKGRIYTLKEYAYSQPDQGGKTLDITDPFGMPYQDYEGCAKEIYDCVQAVIKKLTEVTFF